MLVGYSHPIFPTDLSGAGIEKMRHHCALSERLFVLLKSLNLHKENAAIADGMVVTVAMSFLHDDFIFKLGHVRWNVQNGLLVSHGDACRRSHHKSSGGAGSDERGFTTKLLGQIRT